MKPACWVSHEVEAASASAMKDLILLILVICELSLDLFGSLQSLAADGRTEKSTARRCNNNDSYSPTTTSHPSQPTSRHGQTEHTQGY